MKKIQCEKKMALLENQLQMLMSSFDCVQIFAMKYDKDASESITFAIGDGPYTARLGQVHEWMMSNMANQFKHAMRSKDASQGEDQ